MPHRQILASLVPQFFPEEELLSCETLHGGLINATYLVTLSSQDQCVLQRVNTSVFTKPELVMQNIERVTSHLKATAPEARNLHLIPTTDGASFVLDGEGGLWRAFNYLNGCIGHESVSSQHHAYEAGFAFGQFLTQIASLDATLLHETLPDFHHTPKRLAAFDEALAQDSVGRAALITPLLSQIDSYRPWVDTLENLRAQGLLPVRTTHNDTKISNVLFDQATNKAVAVIDLDTVMPGTALYDFGDLVRTTVNTASEADGIEAVTCRLDRFNALAHGYLEAAGHCLTDHELSHLVFSARLITFELALRFLTDFLQGDQYFRVSHEMQNLDRAKNQLRLVELLEENSSEMQHIINEIVLKLQSPPA